MLNKYVTRCADCGKVCYPGQATIRKLSYRRWLARCAPGNGCNCTFVLPSAQAILPVDVQNSDGTVSIGYLLADGQLVTRR